MAASKWSGRHRVTGLVAIVGGLALVVSAPGLALVGHPSSSMHRTHPVSAAVARFAAPLPNIGTASETMSLDI
jgi:hypothetical protein